MPHPWSRVVSRLVFMAAIAAALGLIGGGLAAQGRSPREVARGHEAVPREVLVKFQRAETSGERAQTSAIVDADEDVDLANNVRRIHSRRFDAATLLNFFEGAPNVAYAEPNYLVYAIKTPNDPSFGSLWGLLNTGQNILGQDGIAGSDIDAANAWNKTTGSDRKSVV